MSEKNAKTPKMQTETNVKTEVVKSQGNGKTIAITVLATVLVCLVVAIAVLLCTGVMKFGDGKDSDEKSEVHTSKSERSNRSDKSDKQSGELIDNPNEMVAVKGTLVEVDDLKFYLPSKFEAGGKNKDGAYTYNLTDDDGWAQVLVYAEKSSLTPAKFLNKISDYLDITDTDYEMNGTSWVQAENANALAYATKLDGKIYAVYYSVKLDSDATGEAMQMLPKTLYMKRIVAE